MGDILTIRLFLLGSALTVGLEAYKATPRAKVGLGVFAAVLAVFGCAYPWITGLAPAVGSTISETIGSPAAWFTLAVALFLVLRPYWTTPRPVALDPRISYDNTELKKDVASLMLQRDNVMVLLKDIAENGTKIDDLEDRILKEIDEQEKQCVKNTEEGARQVTLLEERVYEKIGPIENSLSFFERKIEQIDVGIAGSITSIKDSLTKRIDDIDLGFMKRIEGLYLALGAVQDRERLTKLSQGIVEAAADLSEKLEGGAILGEADWDSWKKMSKAWAALVAHWIEIADTYERGVGDEIAKLQEAFMKGEWTVKASQFPRDSGLYEYQTFRIRLRNWESARDRVEDRVRRVAFEGQAEAIFRGDVR